MATIASAKDKNFIGVVAMNLGLSDIGSHIMTAPGAVEVPVVVLRKLEDAVKGKVQSVSITEARQAQDVLRKAGV